MERYFYALRPETPAGILLASLLLKADFDAWYANGLKTQGSMAGSAKLSWPPDNRERIALQLELLRRLAQAELRLLDFTHTSRMRGNRFDDDCRAFFERILMPFHNDIVRLLKPQIDAEEKPVLTPAPEPLPYRFVDPQRFSQLKAIRSNHFDFAKVIRLCEEIDFCYGNECHLAVSALTRALLDHVPPVFGARSFGEVVNNYPGSRSFKDSMQHLEQSARKMGDAHLHTSDPPERNAPHCDAGQFLKRPRRAAGRNRADCRVRH